jgi:hypothetical protein
VRVIGPVFDPMFGYLVTDHHGHKASRHLLSIVAYKYESKSQRGGKTYCGNVQVVENTAACLPDSRTAVLHLTFVIEAIDLGDLSTFMVSP